MNQDSQIRKFESLDDLIINFMDDELEFSQYLDTKLKVFTDFESFSIEFLEQETKLQNEIKLYKQKFSSYKYLFINLFNYLLDKVNHYLDLKDTNLKQYYDLQDENKEQNKAKYLRTIDKKIQANNEQKEFVRYLTNHINLQVSRLDLLMHCFYNQKANLLAYKTFRNSLHYLVRIQACFLGTEIKNLKDAKKTSDFKQQIGHLLDTVTDVIYLNSEESSINKLLEDNSIRELVPEPSSNSSAKKSARFFEQYKKDEIDKRRECMFKLIYNPTPII